MRQVASKGSAKAFYLEPAHVLKRLKTAARQAMVAFPQISEVLLFGSLARGTQTGLSDIDLAILLSSESAQVDPLERARRPRSAAGWRRQSGSTAPPAALKVIPS